MATNYTYETMLVNLYHLRDVITLELDAIIRYYEDSYHHRASTVLNTVLTPPSSPNYNPYLPEQQSLVPSWLDWSDLESCPTPSQQSSDDVIIISDDENLLLLLITFVKKNYIYHDYSNKVSCSIIG